LETECIIDRSLAEQENVKRKKVYYNSCFRPLRIKQKQIICATSFDQLFKGIYCLGVNVSRVLLDFE
jgi:hypothetical protein